MPGIPPNTSLEHWAVLCAVVDHGSFEAAAEALNRSQSSISYSLRRLQERLPVALLETRGRRAELTAAGERLLRHARGLLESAAHLEALAATLAAGWEAEVRLAVDNVCPPEVLLRSLQSFSEAAPLVRVQLLESVLSGTSEALLLRTADLALTGRVPPGFLGDPLLMVEFLAVAHPDHPLHQLGRGVTAADLRLHRQVVIRDTGQYRQVDAGWLEAEQRWTVSHLRTAIETIRRGLTYAWVPRAYIESDLQSGALRPLNLVEGLVRNAQLHLVYADRDAAGPAARALAAILQREAAVWSAGIAQKR